MRCDIYLIFMSNSENNQFETSILYYLDIIKFNFGILTKTIHQQILIIRYILVVYTIKKQYKINFKIF